MKSQYVLSSCALIGSLLCASVADAQSASRTVAGRTGTPHPHVPELRGGGAPVNDECANAASIALVAEADCATMATAGDNGASTTSTGDPGCDASEAGYQDVWYTFNSGDNGMVLLTLTPDAAMTDYGIVVLDGCDGTELACAVVPSAPINVHVTANTDYVVRVYSNLDYGVGGPFTLCAVANGYPPPPPANDLCSSVTPEALAAGGSLIFTGDNSGSLMTDDFVPGSGIEAEGMPTAWHAFTTTECTDVTVDYCGTDPAFENLWVFLSPSCPAGDDLIIGVYDFATCPDGNGNIVYSNLPAGTYYLPVMMDEAGAMGPYTVNVNAVACPLPPPNDDCAGAVILPADGTTCVTTSGTVAGATQSMDPLLCNGYTSNNAIDVWYSFVCAATDQVVTVQGTGSFDAVVELLEGSCDGLTSISCADATITDPAGAIEEIIQGGLTVGNTYYVRLYTYNNASTQKDFTVCVKSSPAGVSEQPAPVSFSLFPNPSNGDVTLTYGDATGVVTFDLLDMAGRTILSQQRTLTKGQNVVLPLAGKLAPGAYSLRLTTATARSSQRLIVK